MTFALKWTLIFGLRAAHQACVTRNSFWKVFTYCMNILLRTFVGLNPIMSANKNSVYREDLCTLLLSLFCTKLPVLCYEVQHDRPPPYIHLEMVSDKMLEMRISTLNHLSFCRRTFSTSSYLYMIISANPFPYGAHSVQYVTYSETIRINPCFARVLTKSYLPLLGYVTYWTECAPYFPRLKIENFRHILMLSRKGQQWI